MANDNVLTTRLEADVSDLKKGLKEAKGEIKKVGTTAKSTEKNTDGLVNVLGNLSESAGAGSEQARRLASSFKSTKTAVAGATKGMTAFKSALIATGIGAAVVALGLLIENWDSVENAVSATYEPLQKINKELEALKDNISVFKAQISAIEAEIKLAEGLGQNTDDLIAQKKELLALELTKLHAQKLAFQTQIGILEARITEVSLSQKLINLLRIAAKQPTLTFINEKALKQLSKAKVNLANTEKAIANVQIALNKEAGTWIDTSKKKEKATEVLKEGTKSYYDAVIKQLRDEQNKVADTTAKYKEFETQIQAVLNKLFTLKTGKPIPVPVVPVVGKAAGVSTVPTTKRKKDGTLEEDVSQELVETNKVVKDELSNFEIALLDFNDAASAIISGGLAETFASIGVIIGEGLSGASDTMKKIGAALLGGLGQILVDIGKAAIQLGTSMIAIKLALKNPVAAIAAGTALVAIGSLFKKKASTALSSIGGGGNVGAGVGGSGGLDSVRGRGSSVNVGSSTAGGRYVFEIAGTKLIGVLQNTMNRNKALGGANDLLG